MIDNYYHYSEDARESKYKQLLHKAIKFSKINYDFKILFQNDDFKINFK